MACITLLEASIVSKKFVDFLLMTLKNINVKIRIHNISEKFSTQSF
jgi:hypothetical protein